MKVECIHGYFKFSEISPGQIGKFADLFDADIKRSGDHYTFADLVDAPDYSIAGGLFLGVPTLSTYEGEPWEVMKENNLVYNFSLGLVVPVLSVVQVSGLQRSSFYLGSDGLILPGSFYGANRVLGYSGYYSNSTGQFLYSEVSFE